MASFLSRVVSHLGGVMAWGESAIIAGASYKDVTHQLPDIPTSITITPQDGFDAPWEIVRAQIGPTTFRVAYKGGLTQDPGTSGYFLWEAKV
jgi:hypothetical protein